MWRDGGAGRVAGLIKGPRGSWGGAPWRNPGGDSGGCCSAAIAGPGKMDLASGPGLAVRATGRAVCGRGAPTSGAQLAGAGRWLGCWATRDGCCERADDARVGPRKRVGLLCARRAGAECGAGLRRWAGAEEGLGCWGSRAGFG